MVTWRRVTVQSPSTDSTFEPDKFRVMRSQTLRKKLPNIQCAPDSESQVAELEVKCVIYVRCRALSVVSVCTTLNLIVALRLDIPNGSLRNCLLFTFEVKYDPIWREFIIILFIIILFIIILIIH